MFSWGLVLLTLPFSLCVCFKVSEYIAHKVSEYIAYKVSTLSDCFRYRSQFNLNKQPIYIYIYSIIHTDLLCNQSECVSQSYD